MNEQAQPQTRKDIETRIITNAWKDESYKQELLSNPKAVIEKEFGIKIADNIDVQILEENSSSVYFVLPMKPTAVAQELSEEDLETVAGGGTPALTLAIPAAIWTGMQIYDRL